MKKFICKYKKSIVAANLFGFLCFGFMLTHFSLTIDEESWILASKNLTMWLYQGRYSIWLRNASACSSLDAVNTI